MTVQRAYYANVATSDRYGDDHDRPDAGQNEQHLMGRRGRLPIGWLSCHAGRGHDEPDQPAAAAAIRL